MTDREVFRNNLYNLMKTAKVKQIDISKDIGVSYQTVSSWVCGRGYPRADAMEKLCRYFNVRQSALTEDHSQEIQEDKLLFIFRTLSQEGKDKLIERAYELKILCPMRKRKNV